MTCAETLPNLARTTTSPLWPARLARRQLSRRRHPDPREIELLKQPSQGPGRVEMQVISLRIGVALDAAEQKSGKARGAALTALAKQVDGDVSGAKDSARVRTMAEAIKALAAVSK